MIRGFYFPNLGSTNQVRQPTQSRDNILQRTNPKNVILPLAGKQYWHGIIRELRLKI